jgi:hypothetical protein
MTTSSNRLSAALSRALGQWRQSPLIGETGFMREVGARGKPLHFSFSFLHQRSISGGSVPRTLLLETSPAENRVGPAALPVRKKNWTPLHQND